MNITTSDLIQIGILITLLGGGFVTLLKFNHVIVDIEDRRKRIDEAAERTRTWLNEGEKKLQDFQWKSHILMITLAFILILLMILGDINKKKTP